MDDPTSATTPPVYSRVRPPRCPECEHTTTTRLEHVIRGDLVTSDWICMCGARWSAERDLANPGTEETRRSKAGIVLDDLRDLVAALDRRAPHFDERRERLVAGMSATLRDQALQRIARLEEAPSQSRDGSR